MPWHFGRRARDTPVPGPMVSLDMWEAHLYMIGRALDGQSEPIRDLAIAWTAAHTSAS